MMRRTIELIVVAALLVGAWLLTGVRHRLIHDITTWDALPSPGAVLPAGKGPGLTEVERVRVVLIDGLAQDTARSLPAFSELCKHGIDLTIDVGFPTISLPVEAALWTGLTQQQSGIVFRSDRPIEPPLAKSIPAQVDGSRAIAENHGYIVRSLGFHQVESDDPQWEQHAHDAVVSDSRLVFVHILRVDTAGHKHGHDSPEYRKTAEEADEILRHLFDAQPDARWFVLSDHGHLPGGGHGGSERSVRQVAGCIVGPGITSARGQLVHVVDVARAIADSVGATLDTASPGRPMSVALAAPLGADQAVPPIELGPAVVALFVLVLGAMLSLLASRPWWLAPWWFVVACASLVIVRGEPTMSTPMIYAPTGRAMYLTWLPALVLAFATMWFARSRTTLGRALVAQLALPFGALAGAVIVTGAWRAMLGADIAPVVPRFTAYLSPLLLIVAHGSAAVALAALGRSVRPASDRPSPPEPPRSEPAAG
jgi:hypothetical protein